MRVGALAPTTTQCGPKRLMSASLERRIEDRRLDPVTTAKEVYPCEIEMGGMMRTGDSLRLRHPLIGLPPWLVPSPHEDRSVSPITTSHTATWIWGHRWHHEDRGFRSDYVYWIRVPDWPTCSGLYEDRSVSPITTGCLAGRSVTTYRGVMRIGAMKPRLRLMDLRCRTFRTSMAL